MEHLKKLENRSYSTIQLLKSASMPAHPPLPPELLLLDRDRWLLVLARNFILLSNATGTHIFVFFLQSKLVSQKNALNIAWKKRLISCMSCILLYCTLGWHHLHSTSEFWSRKWILYVGNICFVQFWPDTMYWLLHFQYIIYLYMIWTFVFHYSLLTSI